MDISRLVKIEHTYKTKWGQHGEPEVYFKFKEFYEELKKGISNTIFEHDITKFKTYYCSGLSIPKDRIKKIESKYGLKKVLDYNKADVIFTEHYDIKNIYNLIAGKFNITRIFVDDNDVSNYTRFPFNYDDILSSIIPYPDNDKGTYYIHNKIGNKIIDKFSFYISGKPLLCISDICEEDLPILTRSDFVINYLDRLLSENTISLTLLALYSKYNAISIKSILRIFNNNLDSKKFLSINYTKKRHLCYNLYLNRNNDVYSKYIILNSNKIKTNNHDIITHNYFTFINSKYTREHYYSIGNLYLKKDIFKKESIDKLKLSILLQCKFFSFNMDNLSTTNKPEGYVILSSEEALEKIESGLINFKALPEKDKDKLVDILLDMIGNLVKVDNIRIES